MDRNLSDAAAERTSRAAHTVGMGKGPCIREGTFAHRYQIKNGFKGLLQHCSLMKISLEKETERCFLGEQRDSRGPHLHGKMSLEEIT